MPTAADAFVIVLAVLVIFFSVSIPRLGDALGRLLPGDKPRPEAIDEAKRD